MSASAVQNWYTASYGGPFRTTRLRAPSLVPNGRIVQQTLVVDAARQAHNNATEIKDESKNVRRRETIFGPDVGEDDEAGWNTGENEGAKVSVDVVKGWVERAKSEEGLHATTTLQALVNLKRPTLLLQQLESDPRGSLEKAREIAPAEQGRSSLSSNGPLHSLKFNYDATTPLVNITLSIHPTPSPVIEGKESIVEDEAVKVVYSGVHSGGFNQTFNLPSQHSLDLSSAIAPMPSPESAIDLNNEDINSKSDLHATSPGRGYPSEDTNRSSIEQGMGNMNIAGATQPDLATVPEVGEPPVEDSRRGGRRFGLFGRRGNRANDVEAQIEMTNRAAEEKKDEDEVKEPERGMRLLIKIEAVGSEGQAIQRRNAQLTHILVTGMWGPDSGATGPMAAGKRVWVIKVVRREAVIGAHTFLLKEIYGLSSSTQTQQSSSYPPNQEDPYASTPNECIVCLTSPRDVVLLPCRHLVVCRDCAVGMVEFGAGGKVARRDEGTTATAETGDASGAAGAAAGTGTAATPPVAGGTTTTGRERRKKKAKGWYCPVCRQPYTSLLRLALPSSDKPADEEEAHPRQPSRAPSIRSFRSTHTLRRVPSITPTLPDGAERMLDSLRPRGARDEDDDDEEEDEIETAPHTVGANDNVPQFVLAPEVDDKDLPVHSENARPRASQEGKGWKEVP